MSRADRWSRRQFVALPPLLAVGTAGCMRLASEDSGTALEAAVDVTIPSDVRVHETGSITPHVRNTATRAGEFTATIAVDDEVIARESFTLDPDSETTLEAQFTPTTPGTRDVRVTVGPSGADETSADSDRQAEEVDAVTADWDGTVEVTGRTLTFEWDETFVPADHADTAEDTRHLAFACFYLELQQDGEILEEYDIGSESDTAAQFVAGAFAPQEISDSPLEEFDGTRGRWLGTDDEQTDLVIPSSSLLAQADTLAVYGYSWFETDSTVEVRLEEAVLETATVPSRDAGESALTVDLSEYNGD